MPQVTIAGKTYDIMPKRVFGGDGGGGGGGSVNGAGANSGAGGNGGRGEVRIYTI